MLTAQQHSEAEVWLPIVEVKATDAARFVETGITDGVNELVIDEDRVSEEDDYNRTRPFQANKAGFDAPLSGANDDYKLGFFSRLLTGRSNKNNADDGYTSEDDDFQATDEAGLSSLEVAEIAAKGGFDPESNSRRMETEISFKEAAQNFGVRQIGHAVHAVEKLAEFSLAKIGMTEHALKINRARHSDYWYQHASELTRGMKKSPHMPFNAVPQPSARQPEAALV